MLDLVDALDPFDAVLVVLDDRQHVDRVDDGPVLGEGLRTPLRLGGGVLGRILHDQFGGPPPAAPCQEFLLVGLALVEDPLHPRADLRVHGSDLLGLFRLVPRGGGGVHLVGLLLLLLLLLRLAPLAKAAHAQQHLVVGLLGGLGLLGTNAEGDRARLDDRGLVPRLLGDVEGGERRQDLGVILPVQGRLQREGCVDDPEHRAVLAGRDLVRHKRLYRSRNSNCLGAKGKPAHTEKTRVRSI